MAERVSTPTREPNNKPRVPVMATSATGSAHPHIDASAMYVWTFHPERWLVMAGELVPDLQRFVLENGVNRVEVDKAGRIHFAEARARLEREGRTVIPYEWAPDGESYLNAIDTRPGGGPAVVTTYISVFESVDVGGRATTCDEEAFAAWLAELVKAGRIPKCTANVARRLLDTKTEQLERARGEMLNPKQKGAATVRARVLEKEVEVLTKYVEGLTEERRKAQPKGRATADLGAAS
jgi:hypothetical protein